MLLAFLSNMSSFCAVVRVTCPCFNTRVLVLAKHFRVSHSVSEYATRIALLSLWAAVIVL